MLPIKVNSLAPLQTAQHLACSIQEQLASAPPGGAAEVWPLPTQRASEPLIPIAEEHSLLDSNQRPAA